VVANNPCNRAVPRGEKHVVAEALDLVTDAADTGRIAKRHDKQLMWTGKRWLVWNARYWQSDPVGAHAPMSDLPSLFRAEAE
ncbi:hypothetical protein FGX01_01980, partial [Xylella fastidiosa subsp. multiplex]|nr:hypothetical protein [Xylella fastidiosa subsp. multiplex]